MIAVVSLLGSGSYIVSGSVTVASGGVLLLTNSSSLDIEGIDPMPIPFHPIHQLVLIVSKVADLV